MKYILRRCAVTITFTFLFPFFGYLSIADASLTLVADGKAVAMIVLPDRPSFAAREGAAILGDHLVQISGARLETVAEGALDEVRVDAGRVVIGAAADASVTYILVGEGKLAAQLGASSRDLGPGGILIRTYSNALVLLGPDGKTPSDPAGTLYAVTKFLEDALGVRYLWPGEIGKVVPRQKSVHVPAMDVQFTPLIRQRRIRWMHYHGRVQVGLDKLGFSKDDYIDGRKIAGETESNSSHFFGWHRLGGSLDLASGHAFGYMWEKYSANHPEWFAVQPNGSRDQSKLNPERSRLCVSNRALIEAIARDKIAELKAKPGRTSVSIGPNDGGLATFCTCPECEKLDAPDGLKVRLWDFSSGKRRNFQHVSLTDRYVYFWNAIAEIVTKEYPDVWLTADAYGPYCYPPVNRTFHPNIAIRFTSIIYTRDKYRREGLEDWDAWAKVAPSIYWRPNLLLEGRHEGTFNIYVHKLAEDVRYMAHYSMIGTDFDACAHNWATQGLNYYVLSRMLWDPDQDVDAVIDDYCQSGFGPAAAEIKAYFARIEQVSDRGAAQPVVKGESGKYLVQPEAYTSGVISVLRKHLDVAEKKAVGDETILARIKFLRYGLDWTDIQAASYRLLKEKGDETLTPELRDRAGKVLARKRDLARKIFTEAPYAVNVAYVYWGGEVRFNALGFTYPKPKSGTVAVMEAPNDR